MSHHLSPLKNNSKNSRKSPYVTSPFSIELQLIYVNSLDMHIGHINIQSEYAISASNVTSARNQHSRDLISIFTPKPLSFNLTHNQHLGFTF
jgi:hypothetical protein